VVITVTTIPVSLESPVVRDQVVVPPINTATLKTSVSITTTSVLPTAIAHPDTPAVMVCVPSTPVQPAKSITTADRDIIAQTAHVPLAFPVDQVVPPTNTATPKTFVCTTTTFAPPTAIVRLDTTATVDSVQQSRLAMIATRQSRRRPLRR
jgi:hypothetical protein